MLITKLAFFLGLVLLIPTMSIAQDSTTASLGPTVTLKAADGYLQPNVVSGDQIEVTSKNLILFGITSNWSGRLFSETEIGGVPCAAGEVVSIEDGVLKRCVLAREKMLGGVDFPAGSELEMRAEPSGDMPVFLASIPRDLRVKPRTFAGGQKLVFNSDATVRYRIVSPPFSEPQLSYPCRWSADHDRILIHANDALAQCLLDSVTTIDGVTLPRYTVIYLSKMGALDRVDLHADLNHDNGHYRSGNLVRFKAGKVT